MRACRNSFIHHYHADAILHPFLTAHLYFLFWISLFLSLEVVSHQFLGEIFIDIFYAMLVFWALYLWLAMMMIMGLDFLYFLAI
jgi:hypothetical protein